MIGTPERSNLTFGFRRVWPEVRIFTINDYPWTIPGYRFRDRPLDSRADWGSDGEGAFYLAEQILSAIFDADTPGYGRLLSWVTRSQAFQAAIVNQLLATERRDQFVLTDSEVLALAPPEIVITPPRARPQWPVTGDKLRFIGTSSFWFDDLKKSAEDTLTIGQDYTLSHIECALSWTAVTLAETGDIKFNLTWFERL